jgi:hypothetical protein
LCVVRFFQHPYLRLLNPTIQARKEKISDLFLTPRKAWSQSRPTKDCKTIGRSGSAHTQRYSFGCVGVCQSRTWSLVAIRLATALKPLDRSA